MRVKTDSIRAVCERAEQHGAVALPEPLPAGILSQAVAKPPFNAGHRDRAFVRIFVQPIFCDAVQTALRRHAKRLQSGIIRFLETERGSVSDPSCFAHRRLAVQRYRQFASSTPSRERQQCLAHVIAFQARFQPASVNTAKIATTAAATNPARNALSATLASAIFRGSA